MQIEECSKNTINRCVRGAGPKVYYQQHVCNGSKVQMVVEIAVVASPWWTLTFNTSARSSARRRRYVFSMKTGQVDEMTGKHMYAADAVCVSGQLML